MGCASSKQSRCRHCGSRSPLSRSYSVPVHRPVPVHHPAERKGDSHHVVALTSSTLGSLMLDSAHQNQNPRSSLNEEPSNKTTINNKIASNDDRKSIEFSKEIIQAKSWSEMINEKIPKFIPKTPIRTPTGEPETINTWEMMEGLEENSPLRLPNLVDRSFSFHAVPDTAPVNCSKPKLQETGKAKSKPLWLHMTDSDTNFKSIISDFDPDIISTFRKALEELSPTNPFHLRSPEPEKRASQCDSRWQLPSPKEAMDVKKANGVITASRCPPNGEDKVVIYFTSLRGVRKTYEDCCHVRVILKGFGVRVDERDVSMHYGFREELKELLGARFNGGLPTVFVKSRYIGGADEIRQLHEDGDLEKALEGCQLVDDESGGGVCEACGDIRFVPCERCSGSCKIYYDDYEDGDEEEEECEGGFQRCPDCNENGIIRCPVCCC